LTLNGNIQGPTGPAGPAVTLYADGNVAWSSGTVTTTATSVSTSNSPKAVLANVPASLLSITTATGQNMTTSLPGFAPQGDGNAAHFLNGSGAWATPAGSGGGCTPTRPSYSSVPIYWDFTSGPPFANIGTAGTLALSVYSTANVTRRNGAYGTAAALEAVSSDNKGLLRTTTTSLGESNDLSVFAWVKVVFSAQWAILLGKEQNSSGGSYAWCMRFNGNGNNTNQWYFDFWTQPSGVETGVSLGVTENLFVGTWHHIGFTYKYSTGAIVGYVDGYAVSTGTTAANTALYWSTHGAYVIGADYGTTTRQWYGLIEDVRIDSTVYSGATVSSLVTSACHSL